MKQQVTFHRDVEISSIEFSAGQTYTFYIMRSPFGIGKWMFFGKKKIMTLDCFANLFVDQNHASWIDQQQQAA